MRILVTGGAGYIGSHTVVALCDAGHQPVVLDNLANGHRESLDRVAKLVGTHIPLIIGDVRDADLTHRVLQDHRCDAVIHFAGLKAVGDSVAQPLDYYEVNVGGTVTLLQAMAKARVKRFVFSSSATVYGEPQTLPLAEDHPRAATSPYGSTKLMVEDVLQDLHRSDPSWNIAVLRYFNPVGAHVSGEIGEDPKGVPNNLMPYVAQVATGQRAALQVWGDDYPTRDGTGERDYIHVTDLAEGHIAALEACTDGRMLTVNLGTGRSYSVLEMVAAFAKASGRDIPYDIAARRPGDVATTYADTRLAADLLGWRAKRGLDDMCADHWRWQSQNPKGFSG